jgi:hypothetical protein
LARVGGSKGDSSPGRLAFRFGDGKVGDRSLGKLLVSLASLLALALMSGEDESFRRFNGLEDSSVMLLVVASLGDTGPSSCGGGGPMMVVCLDLTSLLLLLCGSGWDLRGAQSVLLLGFAGLGSDAVTISES